MPTKTERILSYLPPTFRPQRPLSALYALVDAFGGELLQAENSLVEIVRAHWVDHADRNSKVIQDLAYIAALYGLAPRPDESVEEFREHLKRYIRTFLEGTVTVQGILRVTAEALGLRIADAYEDLDTWWTRDGDEIITLHPRGDDAAERILGMKAARVMGQPARSARAIGTVDLSSGIDLQEAFRLSLGVNEGSAISVSFAEVEGVNLEAVTLAQIKSAINTASQEVLGADLASDDGHFLILTSPRLGSESRLEIHDVANDSAPRILGLAPRLFRGQAATAARVTGAIDLSHGVDLSQDRYLRLAIDGTHLAEIDCAGSNPAQTTLNQIRDAINNAFDEIDIASHDGHFLRLTSPTTEFNSSIAFQRPAARDATTRLFGSVLSFYTGQDEQPARVTSRRDLSGGVDLSDRSTLQLRIGNSSAIINCVGADPSNTRPFEIVSAINAAFGTQVASQDGRSIALSSPTAGLDAEIAIETPPTGDATEVILGIGSRTFAGTDATAAQLLDRRQNPEQNLNLLAQRFLQISVDGGSPVRVDLHRGVADPQNATVGELARAINQALGSNIASEAGQRLGLRAPTPGAASRLTILPLTTEQRQRFVTRAIVTDEATQAIFGFITREAQGEAETRARLVGQPDLSRGVDLRNQRYLRLAIDDRSAVEIDCAGKRPRATLLDEVVNAINTALGGIEVAIASNHKHLMLTSPSSGTGSRILLEPPRAEDALDKLLGIEPGTFRGQAATRVNFVGTVDLSTGVDLSTADRIEIAIDNEDFIEISCAGDDAANTTLNEIIQKINTALREQTNLGSGTASDDGVHLMLNSNTTGTASRIRFEVPDGADATALLFGITPPRAYQGADPVPARVIGNRDLSADSGSIHLSITHFLRLVVDNRSPVTVDFSRLGNPQATHLDEIVDAINNALGIDTPGETPVASHDGRHLILRSQQTGLAGRITIEAVISGDARQALLGSVEALTTGTDPSPATITGDVDLLAPVDLSQRCLIRVAVDGNPATDIDVAGAAPGTTFLDEIVTAINAVFPGLATATEDNRLQLTSPTTGEDSYLSLLPLRYLDLIEYVPTEYPPELINVPSAPVRHGDSWHVDNDGATDAFAKVELFASQGVVGPTLINVTLGWRIHLRRVLSAGERVKLWPEPTLGLQAVILSPNGDTRLIPGNEIGVGPLGSQSWVPFSETRYLTSDADGEVSLQLNNPLAPNIVRLRGRLDRDRDKIAVTVTEADLSTLNSESPPDTDSEQLVGLIQADNGTERLVDGEGVAIAGLKAGSGVNLAAYQNRVVVVKGQLYADATLPLMVVETIALLFDVSITVEPESDRGDSIEELYRGVAIGRGTTQPDALVHQINTGSHASRLVSADELNKGLGLTLPQGRSTWLYQDCYGSRFNQADFNQAKFAGGHCLERGVFNVSRFAQTTLQPHLPPESMVAVFAASPPFNDPLTEIRFHWLSYQPGTFRVNLPADLPARFGGKFNASRFGQGETAPELYEQAVIEPLDDERFLARLVKDGDPDEDSSSPSRLVKVIEPVPSQLTVPLVPLGWEAVQIPFRQPQFLTLGSEDAPARVYLTGEGLDGFIGLEATEAGEWGNEIAIAVRSSGPAMYDVSIIYKGEHFENARQVVLGTPLPALTQDLLKPSAIGILQAKAAGIEARVSRDRAESHSNQHPLQ